MDANDSNELVLELAKAFMYIVKCHQKIQCHQKIKKSEFVLLSAIIEMAGQYQYGIKASDLSNKLKITPAAVTHMLNSLEKNKYIERLSDPSDRRIVLVKATEKTKETINEMQNSFLKKFEGLTNFLSENDTKELIRLLNKSLVYLTETESDEKV
ncbi:MAG: MarR family transcriptional regulator [Bacillota bacterium]|nr:MarR family transcriptional regulator [Bacillota bacterium]